MPDWTVDASGEHVSLSSQSGLQHPTTTGSIKKGRHAHSIVLADKRLWFKPTSVVTDPVT